jgi:hypothetical protein
MGKVATRSYDTVAVSANARFQARRVPLQLFQGAAQTGLCRAADRLQRGAGKSERPAHSLVGCRGGAASEWR